MHIHSVSKKVEAIIFIHSLLHSLFYTQLFLSLSRTDVSFCKQVNEYV